MTDRNATLQWLVHQAKDHEGEGPFALHRAHVTKAKAAECLASGKVVLDDDLAWDLATSSITKWSLPPFPEFETLDDYERVNLLKLAVELSIYCKLHIAPWLAMAAHSFSHHVDVGLGESGLRWLIETLQAQWDRRSHFSSVEGILRSFDLMIGLTPADARVVTVILGVVSVTDWLHYPAAFPNVRATGFPLSSMMDWIERNSRVVIAERTAPDAFKLEAYGAACNSKYISAYRALKQGDLPPSDVVSWHEDEVACIWTPCFSDQGFEDHLGEIAETFSLGLAAITASWLLDHDRPLAAKKYVDWAFGEFPQLTDSHSAFAELAIVRAFANARLGHVTKAASELEPSTRNLHSRHYWPAGRLWCETEGTCERGLDYLRRAVALPEEIGFSAARSRMRLLLAEREVEFGDPAHAVVLTESMVDERDSWISVHATVVLGEALLALARTHVDKADFYLHKASNVLNRLDPERVVDTPDRILPRVRAAKGEIHLRRGQFREARSLFRLVMSQLEGPVPISWGTGNPNHFTYLTPDDAPHKYPRRPWPRSWLSAAEFCLVAELSEKVESNFAFTQLQRYRTITHSGTIAELAGFTPTAASAPGMLEKQEDLHLEAVQLKAHEDSLLKDHQAVQESIRDRWVDEHVSSNSEHELKSLAEQESGIWKDLQRVRESSKDVAESINKIHEEVIDTRGYLSRPNGIQRPEIDELRRTLGEEEAAVLELVRVDGTPWGLPVKCHAFTVTPNEGVTHVELPAAKIDHELSQLRSDRTKWQKDTIGTISDLIIANLPRQLFLHSNLFIAADGDAWAIPFRSLVRRRWRFVPWKFTDESTYSNWRVPAWLRRFLDSLAPRMDRGVVSNVISTSHLVRLFQRSRLRKEHENAAVVVGSSGGSEERELCQGFATSLDLSPPGGAVESQWRKYPGSVQASTPPGGDRPEWLEGTSRAFMGSWHTSFSADPTTVAIFHFDDRQMPLAEFLSRSRHKTNIAVILSCNISLPTGENIPSAEQCRIFSRMGSAGFGIVESLQAEAMVATTNEVTAEVAFVLGRFLAAELADGADVHTALAASQQRLRECSVGDVIHLLEELEQDVPETEVWLKALRDRKSREKAFPNRYDTEPFYILGLPTARLGPRESHETQFAHHR